MRILVISLRLPIHEKTDAKAPYALLQSYYYLLIYAQNNFTMYATDTLAKRKCFAHRDDIFLD